jgi:hypothetical protein
MLDHAAMNARPSRDGLGPSLHDLRQDKKATARIFLESRMTGQ